MVCLPDGDFRHARCDTMAAAKRRVSREEWVDGLAVGDTVSATLPPKLLQRFCERWLPIYLLRVYRRFFGRERGPTVGRCIGRAPYAITVELGDERLRFDFMGRRTEGKLVILLQPVATGSGGSVAPPIKLSQIVAGAQARDGAA